MFQNIRVFYCQPCYEVELITDRNSHNPIFVKLKILKNCQNFLEKNDALSIALVLSNFWHIAASTGL